MKYKIFTLIWLIYFCIVISKAILVQDLGGTGWTAINANKSINVSSRVPGSIYSDLERENVIPDVYKDYNDLALRWVSYDNWTFERSFDVVDGAILEQANIYLTAHGLDTIGQVYLNGHQLGSVYKMFVRYRWNVKEWLKAKDNRIKVAFVSAPIVAKQLYDTILKQKYSIPPVCPAKSQKGECHVNMLRKMQASFSWDWGPAVPTQGIWKRIEIEAFNELIIRSISVDTHKLENNQWSLNYTVHLEGAPMTESKGIVTIDLDKSVIDSQQVHVHFDANGEASIQHLTLLDSKLNIKAWYPNGLGTQQLYNLTTMLKTASGESIASKSIKIGFRTVELVQKRLNESTVEAYSFYFSVNGQPVYSKGSNWIPVHVLYEKTSESYIRELLKSAALANINMLRVWGGGLYESNRFYEIADEYGIMIWQNMMFACAFYPTEKSFLESVRIEIRQQLRRLQHHPSIVLWAGNNENESGITEGWSGIKTSGHYDDYRNDYYTLYIDTIKQIVQQEDLSRPFVGSSPSNGIKDPSEHFMATDPQSELYGDVHFYRIKGNMWDWRMYPSPKFASEYGFQSWSSLQTLGKAISSEHLKYPLDGALVHRQHFAQGLESLDAMIGLHMSLPTHGNYTKLQDYIYLTQVFQSMAIKIETEHYRRNRAVTSDGRGNTMGALYWQLNDIWPTVSWASLEFGGKWKMLHYFVRHMFDNLLVNAYVDKISKAKAFESEKLKVVIVRDDHFMGAITFKLEIDVFDWSNLAPIYKHQVQVETKSFSVTVAFHEAMDQFMKESKCKSRNNCFIQVAIFQSNVRKITNFLLLGEPKDAIGLQKAHIQIKSISQPTSDPTEADAKVFNLELETDNLAIFVWIDFLPDSNMVGIFSDNGFMMTNRTVHLTFKTKQTNITSDKLRQTLTVKSLKDVNN